MHCMARSGKFFFFLKITDNTRFRKGHLSGGNRIISDLIKVMILKYCNKVIAVDGLTYRELCSFILFFQVLALK